MGGEVKFDIWEEADLEHGETGETCDEREDAGDGAAYDTSRVALEDFDNNFSQHPLVVWM